LPGVKIERVSFFKAVSPLSQPIADSTHQIPEIAFIVTRIECEGGVMGEAYLLAFHYSPNAIVGALRDAAELALGWDVNDTAGFTKHFEREAEYFGNPGLNRWGLASINIAMWDAKAGALGLPVWKMFDAHADKVPLYGSGGWISYTTEELIAEATGYVKRGFQAVKIKVGSPELGRDVERLTKVREAVGPGIDIMMDANQGMDLESATALSEAARNLRITWFEEPLPNTDFDGYAALRKRAGISLAMGEREFNSVALRELIARDAIDLWQPDILRLGGVEEWRDSAALALDHRVPVLPHYYKEYDVPLLMTIPNGRGSESFDWVDPLITNPIRMQDGFAYPSDQPGWGFRFKDECLKEIAIC
jgi:L-alanine-DL-glutamate epimerase-like enolase superfamily enzyme